MSQSERLYAVLCDGQPHRSDALVQTIYGVSEGVWLARLSARVYDVKRRYGVTIRSWPDRERKTLWWYQLIIPNYQPELRLDDVCQPTMLPVYARAGIGRGPLTTTLLCGAIDAISARQKSRKISPRL